MYEIVYMAINSSKIKPVKLGIKIIRILFHQQRIL